MTTPPQDPQDPYGGRYAPDGPPTQVDPHLQPTRIVRPPQAGDPAPPTPPGQYAGGQYAGGPPQAPYAGGQYAGGPPPGQYAGGPPPGQYGSGQPGGYGGPPQRPTSVVAVVGLVLAVLVSPVGLVVSCFGLRDTGGGRKGGRGIAVAGVIVGAVGTVLWLAAVVFAVYLVRTAASTYDDVASQIEQLPTELPSGLPSDLQSALPSDLPSDLQSALDAAPVDATGDATVTDCSDDGAGGATGAVSITNSSDAVGTYVVNVYAYDASGEKIGELGGVSDDVEPGDTGTADLSGYVNDGATIATCEVVQTLRSPSQ